MAMYLRGVLFRPRIQPHIEGREGVQVRNERRALPLTVYSLGSPRVFDDILAMAYDHELGDKTFRLVHGGDIVTQLPPYRWGYTHVGSPIFLSSDGSIDRDPGPAEKALGGAFQLEIPRLFEISRTLMSTLGGVLDHSIGSGPLTNNGPLPGWVRFFIPNGGYLGDMAKGLTNSMAAAVVAVARYGIVLQDEADLLLSASCLL